PWADGINEPAHHRLLSLQRIVDLRFAGILARLHNDNTHLCRLTHGFPPGRPAVLTAGRFLLPAGFGGSASPAARQNLPPPVRSQSPSPAAACCLRSEGH